MLAPIRAFLDAHGSRLLRYCAVSGIGVVLGQTLLLGFHSVLGWSAAVSNLLAVSISTVPSYLLNRKWVWGRSGSHHLRGEVLPFWAMAFLGLILSTLSASWAANNLDAKIWVNIANLAAFGVLWVAKFFVLDRVLFAPNELDPDPVHASA